MDKAKEILDYSTLPLEQEIRITSTSHVPYGSKKKVKLGLGPRA